MSTAAAPLGVLYVGFKQTPDNKYLTRHLLPSKSVISDERKNREIQNLLRRTWNVKHLNPNPCALPVTLESAHLDVLRAQLDNYVVTEKSDGVRYFLVLGRDGSSYLSGDNHGAGDEKKKFSVMVNRNLAAFEVSVAAKNNLFDGTVLDGELVWEHYSNVNPPRQAFLVFDVLMVAGDANIQTANYVDRLQEIHRLVSLPLDDLTYSPSDWVVAACSMAKDGKIVSLGNSHNIIFTPKPCRPLRQLDILLRNMSKYNHLSDGLIFMPVADRVRRGRQRALFKWKHTHTVDLLFRIVVPRPPNRSCTGDRVDNQTPTTTTITTSDEFMPSIDLLPSIEMFCLHNKEYVNCADVICFEGQPAGMTVSKNNPLLASLLMHLQKKKISAIDVLLECEVVYHRSRDYYNNWEIIPIGRRTDKPIPNSLETIEKTLISVFEAITLHRLLDITVPGAVMTAGLARSQSSCCPQQSRR